MGRDDEGKLTVTSLQRFEASVLESLWSAVSTEFPAAPPPTTYMHKESGIHDFHMEVGTCCLFLCRESTVFEGTN